MNQYIIIKGTAYIDMYILKKIFYIKLYRLVILTKKYKENHKNSKSLKNLE